MYDPAADHQFNDDVSLKDIIKKILELWIYLRSRWVIIIMVGSLCGAIGYIYAFSKKAIYTATLSFALEDEKSSGVGNLSGALGIASSLGLDIGGGNAGSAFSGANLIELMKSRSVVEKTLLQPVVVNGQTISLVTHYMQVTKINEQLAKDSVLKHIQFQPLSKRNSFTLQQDSLLGIFYSNIVEGLLSVGQKDKKISILTIEVKSEDELFAKYFTENLARVVSDFYVETRSKKARLNFEILEKQTDSIRNELNMAISGVAQANDMTYNLNPALNVKRIPSAKKQIDVQANTAILTQLVANLEMAKVALRKETPLIQIIDAPILPLPKEKLGKVRTALLGGFIGVILIITFFISQRLIRRVLE